MSTRLMLIVALGLFGTATPVMADVFEASPSTLSLPDGPGSIMGMGEEFDVAPGTGIATYGLPVPLLPAPGSFVPSLALRYQSGAGNGPLGIGWSLESARLCRKTDAGAPLYGGAEDGDAFFLDGSSSSGDIVPLAEEGGRWGPRVEGSWIRLRPNRGGDGEGWELTHPDGRTSWYGTTPDSREGPVPSDFGGTFCWALSRQEDAFGRAIEYTYRRDGGRLHLSEVRYAVSTPHPRSVRLSYRERDDRFTDHVAGYPREHRLLLESIESVVLASSRNGGERIVRRMELEYATDWNASRLIEVRMEGEEGLALPPQSFRYQVFDPGRASVTEEFDAPRIAPEDGRHRLVDLNGNGRPDILRINEAGRWAWYPNEGGRGFLAEAIDIASAPTLSATADWIFMDVNGNGRRDILSRTLDGSVEVRWNQGRGGRHVAFGVPESLGVSVPVALRSPQLHVMDLNGNRRPDFLWSAGGQLWIAQSRVEREADGRILPGSRMEWLEAAPVADAEGGQGSGVTGLDQVDLGATGQWLVDMNGDGLPDLVRAIGGAGRTTALVVHEGMGRGRFDGARVEIPVPEGARGRAAEALQLVDLNGSGLADLVWVGPTEVQYWLNTGGSAFEGPHALPLPARSPEARVAVTDLSGNGAIDFVVVDPRAERGWTVVDPVGDQPNGLLLEAANGLGGTYRIEYATLDGIEAASNEMGRPWRSWTPQPMTVVVAREARDGRGTRQRTEHIYRDPVFNERQGQFQTFESATVTVLGDDQAANQVTDHVFFRGTEGDLDGFGGALADENPGLLPSEVDGLGGQPRAVIVRESSGALIRRELTRVDIRTLEDGRHQILVTGTLVDQAERLSAAPELGDWTGEGVWPEARLRAARDGEEERRLTLSEVEHDGWGNPRREIAWGFVSPSGEPLSDEPMVRTTTWINDIERWMIGFELAQQVETLAGDVLSRTRQLYDGPAFEGLPLGRLERGLVTRTEQWFDEEQRWIPIGRNAFDEHGNVIASLDALGHRVELEYDDALHMFPVRERLRLDLGDGATHRAPDGPASLEVRAEYDTDLGLMTAMRDFNGQVTRLVHDGLGRVIERHLPGDAPGEPAVRFQYMFGNPVSWVETAQLESFDSTERLRSRSYVDGFGREITTLREHGERGSGQWIASGWTTYTATGAPASVFLAFLAPSIDLPDGPDKDVGFAATFYDAAGRAIRTVYEDGSTESVRHGAGTTWTFDANRSDPASPFVDLPEMVVMDGHGRTVLHRLQVDGTADGTRDYRYGYDVRGLPLWRELPDGSRTTWRHDSLGRTREASDPNAGTHRRHFDDLGRVIALEDASGGLVLHDFDAAGRLVRTALQTPGGEPVEDARYHYDVAVEGFPSNFPLGRLVARHESGFDTFLDYDRRGQVSRIFRRFEDRIYTSGASWDAAGRVAAHHYMDGTSLQPRYDAQGNLRQYGDVVREVDYTVEGQLERMAFGNGLEQRMAYDQRLRPIRYTLGTPGNTPLLDLEQRHDAAGIPTSLHDHVTPTGLFSQ
ncbi:MAG: hypothetical protein EA398_02060, partial [Deltaproteobacteria bacterium]